jgi:hypothetical protein
MKIVPVMLLLVATAVAGCASPQATSGDRAVRLGAPPFVVHHTRASAPSSVVVLSPVMLDRVTARDVLVPSQAEMFSALAAAMDERLVRMPCCTAIEAPLPDNGAPLVYVGSATGRTAPQVAARLVESWDKYPPMAIHVQPPSAEWRAHLGARAAQTGAPAFLWIRLALADFPLTESKLFIKEIVLGEGLAESRPYLLADLEPTQVLQVTGVLLAPDGTVLAAGAEGIFAVDARLDPQALGQPGEINAEQVRAILTELRREDLPGQPMRWEAALDNLVKRLLQGRRAP